MNIQVNAVLQAPPNVQPGAQVVPNAQSDVQVHLNMQVTVLDVSLAVANQIIGILNLGDPAHAPLGNSAEVSLTMALAQRPNIN